MSRKLDALFAKKVLDWFTVDRCIINEREIKGPLLWHPSYGNPLNPTGGACPNNYGSATNSFDAAWLGVEKLRQNGWRFSIYLKPNDIVDVWIEKSQENSIIVDGGPLVMALVEGCLLVEGVTKKEIEDAK